MSFKDLFKRKQDKKAVAAEMEHFAKVAKEFVDDNPEALVILGDPKSDVIFMAHQGVIAPIRILDKYGKPQSIVGNTIKHKRGQGDIDRFLLAVDGGLFAIAKTLYDRRRDSFKGKVIDWVMGTEPPPAESLVKLADGATLSPIQVVN